MTECLLGSSVICSDLYVVIPFCCQHQHALETSSHPVQRQAMRPLAFVNKLKDEDRAVGFFNRSGLAEHFAFSRLDRFGCSGARYGCNPWRQKDLAWTNEVIRIAVPAHGILLYKLLYTAKSQEAPNEQNRKASPHRQNRMTIVGSLIITVSFGGVWNPQRAVMIDLLINASSRNQKLVY